MLPAVTASQIQQGLKDFLKTNFSISSPYFHNMLEEFIENGNAFRGPYLSLGLPFAEGKRGRNCFPELLLKFPPYRHQEEAFTRLSRAEPVSTLVATGTGSGKTECFLYPVLDYCRQHARRPGIKAILIYPMNALATDQARRLAEFIHNTPSLKGEVRAGLYVGQQEATPKMVMGETHVITDKEVMRAAPPDILLTNYKMLDYMLVRHQDRDLWQHNEPDTLKYLVVDELHTFDGAQGTDLACLVRRLKARLNTPKDGLCCVGTSATLGSEGGVDQLRRYAEEIFGESFEANSIIREHRVSAAEFLGDGVIKHAFPPQPSNLNYLNPESFSSPDEYLSAQYLLWFSPEVLGESVDPQQTDIEHVLAKIQTPEFRVQLGHRLKEHLLFQNLVRDIKGEIKDFDELLDTLRPLFQGIKGATKEYRSLVLLSLLSLISHARREIAVHNDKNTNSIVLPFLNVRLQLWLRELARMVTTVQKRDEQKASHPVLRFSADVPENSIIQHLPLVHCRECGTTGWLGLTNVDHSYYRTDLKPIYSNFFSKNGSYKIFFPDVEEARDANAEGYSAVICGSCKGIQPRPTADGTCCKCHDDNLIEVFIPETSSKDCPLCKAKSSMLLLGSRSASLTSTIISLLFACRYNDDKKLITFSDNVQDAAHRAGFFGARTYGFTLKTAIQQCLQAQEEQPTLKDFPELFRKHWSEKLDKSHFISTFIHPGMEWLHDYDRLKELGELPSESHLLKDIEKRLGWDIYATYGLRSRIGRTLEKTSASIAYVNPNLVNEVTEKLTPILTNEFEALRSASSSNIATFLLGLLAHMRQNGAIHHSVLTPYITNWGNVFTIRQKVIPWMPTFGVRHKLPKMLTSRVGVETFEPVFKVSGKKQTWCTRWATKNFNDLERLGLNTTQPIYDYVFKILVESRIVIETELEKNKQKHKVWALNPESLLLTTNVSQFRCAQCGHTISTAQYENSMWEDSPCSRYGCKGKYTLVSSAENYYGKLYRTGEVTRLFTAEHTGLLSRDDREKTEEAFKASNTNRKPWFPNLLSCTPTLEMGIDIGNLSSTVQCSVPPAQANYLQRIGRAGRKDGNALNITIANAKAHDLYFFESPQVMMDGDVESPGVFLNASAVLERQLTAFSLDRWVMAGITEKDMPRKLVTALSAVDKRNEQLFPYNFLRFIEINASDLLSRFLEIFEGKLSLEAQAHLVGFIHGKYADDTPMEAPLHIKIVEGLARTSNERKSLQKKATNSSKEIKKLEDDPAIGEASRERIQELKRETAGLRKLARDIGQKDILNFFTDEGLLPNYAFPEQGVTLHSIVYRQKDQPDENGKYNVTTFDYERAAQSALTELAPGNTFYAGKRKVCIDQVDIETSEAEEWRLCPDCSFSIRTAENEQNGACPNCGAELFADAGQKRLMIKMSQVFATTSDRKSRVADDSDSRDPQFFIKQLLVGYDPKDVTEAWKLDTKETVFGYAFLSRVSFREINFGEFCDDEDGLSVAGVETPKKGFRICAQCGKLLRPNSTDKDHTFSCPSRKKDAQAKILDCVYLYRDFTSEAIKVLLPFTGAGESQSSIESFIAAFNLGLKLKFGGSISHLRSTLYTEPDDQDRALRKQFLVIYDSVPGGTGYLKELMRDDLIFDVLDLAYNYLTNCKCNEKPELDGCYRCLLAYRNSTQMRSISKQSALEILAEILEHRDTLTSTTELRTISLSTLFESELEYRFIEALRRQNSEELRVKLEKQIINGREGFFLEIGESRWNIEQQVPLDTSNSVSIPSRVDFLFTPARSGMNSLPIAIFTDGFTWHKNRIGTDTTQRMAIVRSRKYLTWSLTYHDVQSVFDHTVKQYSEFIKVWDGDKTKIWNKICPSPNYEISSENSFSMLIKFLATPNFEGWKQAATAYAMCSVKAPAPSSEELSIIQSRCPSSMRDCAFSNNANYFGQSSSTYCTLWFSAQKTPRLASAALWLDDSADNLNNHDFEAEWIGFLRAYNLFQFLEHTALLTRSGVDEGSYDDIITASTCERISHPTQEEQAEWNEIQEMALDEFHPVLSQLIEEKAPVPEVGYELEFNGVVIGEVELAWINKKVGLVADEYQELQNNEHLSNWKLFTLADIETDFSKVLNQII